MIKEVIIIFRIFTISLLISGISLDANILASETAPEKEHASGAVSEDEPQGLAKKSLKYVKANPRKSIATAVVAAGLGAEYLRRAGALPKKPGKPDALPIDMAEVPEERELVTEKTPVAEVADEIPLPLNANKGIYAKLNSEHRHLALVHGEIAWKSGIIRRMYDFGQIFPEYETKGEGENARTTIARYNNSEKTHAVIKLIHLLFYRIPGSTTEADFGVTKQLESRSDLAIAGIVGTLLALCNEFMTLRVDHEQKKSELINKKNELARIFLRIDSMFENNGAGFISVVEKKSNKEGISADIFQVYRFFKIPSLISKELKKLFKSSVVKENIQFDELIIKALRECDPLNPDALYPGYMVQLIFQAFVWKKCGEDLNAIKAYYEALSVQLPEDIESFEPVTQSEAIAEIERILAPTEFGAVTQSISDNYEDFMFNYEQIRGFPAPVGFLFSKYYYACNSQPNKYCQFPDCMDNSIRNFINLFAYDSEANQYNSEKLQTNFGLTSVHEAVKSFLQRFKIIGDADTADAHSEWLHVVSDIPYVVYKHIVSDDRATEDCLCIKITTKDLDSNTDLDAFCDAQKYKIIEPDAKGCEVKAGTKNLIIILSHILNLNLFDESEGGLAKEFMLPDFINKYFPKLCEKLGAKGSLSADKEQEKGIIFDDTMCIDSNINVAMANIECQFSTRPGHGQLKLINASGSAEDAKLNDILQERKIDFVVPYSLSFLLAQRLYQLNKKPVDYLRNKLSLLYAHFFALPIDNPDIVNEMINNRLSDFRTQGFSLAMRVAIKDLLLRLTEKQPDRMQSKLLKPKVYQEMFLPSLQPDESLYFNEVALVAQEALDCSIARVKQLGGNLIDQLLLKKQGFGVIWKVAQKYMTANPFQGLKWFEELVKNDQFFKEALSAAQTAVKSTETVIAQKGIFLMSELVKKGMFFTEAYEIVKDIIEKGNPDTYGPISISVFPALVQKQQYIEEAIDFVMSEKYVRNKKSYVDLASMLFEYAERSEKGPAFAISCLKYYSRSDVHDDDQAASSMKLLQKLLLQGRGIEEAHKFINGLGKNYNFTNQIKDFMKNNKEKIDEAMAKNASAT